MNDVKQAVIAELCEHPQVDEYRQRAFAGVTPEEMLRLMQEQLRALTKADFLARDDKGRLMLDNPGAWKNFSKIAALADANGDRFSYEDFVKPIASGGKEAVLLDVARANRGLADLFTPGVWQGHFEEMERLWYKVPFPNRKEISGKEGTIPPDLKRQLFAAEGKITPEDRLAKAGLTPLDVRNAFSSDKNFEEVTARLRQAGDGWHKEYALILDGSGDTVFFATEAWDRYDRLVKALQESGELLDIQDYTRQVSFAPNILGRAAENKALDKVFSPAHWVDRLPDMLQAWSQVRDGWKMPPMTRRDFDTAYTEAENLTYTARFQELAVAGKGDLLKPLNKATENGRSVLPLGLRAVWDKLDAIVFQLDKLGEQLTTSDLRASSGQMGNSCLIAAAKFGYFDKAVAISRKSKEPLTLADFLSKDSHGDTLLNILAEKGQLSAVFAPDIWAGRVKEMKELWAQVGITQRSQIDFLQAEISAKQSTLKQNKSGGIRLQPRHPKKASG